MVVPQGLGREMGDDGLADAIMVGLNLVTPFRALVSDQASCRGHGGRRPILWSKPGGLTCCVERQGPPRDSDDFEELPRRFGKMEDASPDHLVQAGPRLREGAVRGPGVGPQVPGRAR